MSIPLSSPQCENLHLEKAVFASTTLNPSSVVRHPSFLIPRGAYSFLAKLTGSDLNSTLRPSNTRPFPPRRTLFLKLSRNNHPRWGFRLPNPQSPIFNPQSPSPILNHQSSITNPSSVLRHPSSLIPRGGYSFLAKLTGSDLNSTLCLSDTRPFPLRRTLFLKLSRNNSSRLSFRLPNPQSVLHRQSSISNHQSSISRPPSSIVNLQSPIINPQFPIPRRPSSFLNPLFPSRPVVS